MQTQSVYGNQEAVFEREQLSRTNNHEIHSLLVSTSYDGGDRNWCRIIESSTQRVDDLY